MRDRESRKQWRRRARATLKRHYFLLVILCLLAIFGEGEFSATGYLLRSTTPVDRLEQISESSEWQVFQKLVTGNFEEGYALSQEYLHNYAVSARQDDPMGLTRGVLATIVSDFSSGSLFTRVAFAIVHVFHNRTVASIVFIILSVFVMVTLWALVVNLYRAALRRMFLEARLYDRVPYGHALFFISVRKWMKSARTVLVTSVFQVLWGLTVVGGLIKHYSYFCVPYIVAENPDVPTMEAIRLSKRMMYGHKWDCFLLDLSFVGWRLLGVVTAGFTDIAFVTPYRLAAYSEFYVSLREKCVSDGMAGTELLCDDALFCPAQPEQLQTAYADIVENERYLRHHTVDLTPCQKFFAEWFAFWIDTADKKAEYEALETRKAQIRRDHDAMRGHSYPERLHPLWERNRGFVASKITNKRCYNVRSLITLFFAVSVFGWVWEVIVYFVIEGGFINRGTMHGPWLPIYGFGSILVLLLFSRLRDHPMVEFLAATAFCGTVEFLTSVILELVHGMRWWDYYGYFLNLDGRICAEGLMFFGIGCLGFVYLAAPMVDMMVSKLRPAVVMTVGVCLSLAFCTDAIFSQKYPNVGYGITEYRPVEMQTEDTETEFDDMITTPAG